MPRDAFHAQKRGRSMDENTTQSSPDHRSSSAPLGIIGTWRIIKDAQNQRFEMYPDANMLKLLGLEAFPGPAECFAHWVSRIEPEDLPKTEKMALRMETTFDFNEVEYRWHHPAWGVIHVRCGGQTDRMTHGVSYQSGYHQNITGIVKLLEQNHSQSCDLAEISRQKQQYNDLFQSVICGITQYYLNADNTMQFAKANREAMRIFGYTPEEFQKKTDWNLQAITAPPDWEKLAKSTAALRRPGDRFGLDRKSVV